MRLLFAGRDDEVIALLDTGFNGALLMAEADVADLGVRVSPLASHAKMGDGRVVELRRAQCTVYWLGELRRTEVLVSSEPDQHRGPDEPVVVIGTQLLAPNMLLIDFSAGSVEIETQD